MVMQQLTRLLVDRFGCDPEEITMAAGLDDLNITEDERCELALVLWELFVAAPLPEEMPAFDAVEDLVGYIEDQMG